MKSKLLVAGAIVVVIVICAMLADASSMVSSGKAQPEVCSVNGYVVDSFGRGLPGLTVTLHFMGESGLGGQVTELYNTTTVTSGLPKAGLYAFDDVAIPRGTQYGYVETSTKVGDITSYGRSNNYSLKPNDNVSMSIVLKLPSEPDASTNVPGMCKVLGTIVDSRGDALSGINTTLYIMKKDASTGAAEEVYNMTRASGVEPNAGMVAFDVFMPEGIDHAYLESITEKDGISYLGRSDNFTLTANGTVNAAVVMHLPP